jgi:lipopolysaccharide export system protein LptA
MTSRLLCIVFFTCSGLFITPTKVYSQPPAGVLSVGDTSGKRLEILEARRYNFQKKDSIGDFVSLAGSVRIRQGKTLFYCDSAVLDQKQNVFEAFGNIHINDDDSIHTYSQYLKYYGREKDALLKNKVKLTDGKGVLTTNELHYNTITKIGTYENGGKVVTGSTVLTSTQGIYYGETRDIYFKKKVVMTDPEFRVTTDTLLYNTFTEIARFTVPTLITNKNRTVTTSEGYYDMKNKKAVFGKRPFINDKDYTLTADDIAIDEQSGFGDALGNAIYKSKDTANPAIIIANRLQSNSNTSALLATQKPVMIIKQGADSIFIAADTLFTAKLSNLRKSRIVPDIESAPVAIVDTSRPARPATLPGAQATNPLSTNSRRNTNNGIGMLPGITSAARDSVAAIDDEPTVPNPVPFSPPSRSAMAATRDTTTLNLTGNNTASDTTLRVAATSTPVKDSSNDRFVEAYFNVKIYSDSMQAVGDSLFYSFEDSAFRLFKDPVVWAQENQITGDTIYFYINDRKPRRMYVFENALAINKVDQFYNQVKGNTINAFFVNGNIDNIRARGSAENIYYAVDDEGKYIGVNRSTSDVIDMYFKERKPKKVVFRSNLKGTTSPMSQVNHNELRLRGFKWLEERRPKSRFELFAN